MNDRFKFRVWNKAAEKFVERFILSPDDGICIISDKCKTYVKGNPNYILMQSTGLHDKNGKLIYEGDIVKFKTPRTGLRIGQVKFDVNCALFEVRYLDNTNDWELMDKYNYEVIGNIYENKELLEECE